MNFQIEPEKIYLDPSTWIGLTCELADIAMDALTVNIKEGKKYSEQEESTKVHDLLFKTLKDGGTEFTELGQEFFDHEILPKIEQVLYSHDIERSE
tara:strand:- start:913 stop:1200 length:288 start_codon:yes stop_codon:yes gene_type:complete